MILISDNNPSVSGDPAEGALDCISSPVAIPESVVLSIDVSMILSMRRKEVDASLSELFPMGIAVIGLVPNHSLGRVLGLPGPFFGILMSARTFSRSLISAGQAESI